MYNAQRPLSGERLSRLYGGVLFWLLLALLFFTIAAGDVKGLLACLVIGGYVAFSGVSQRETRRKRMRDQVWAEVVERNPTAARSYFLEQAENAWKRELGLDCLRLGIGAVLAALLCLLMMATAVKQGGGRWGMRAHQVFYSLYGRVTPELAFYVLARLGLFVLTPLHALVILVHFLLYRNTPDFSELARNLPSPPDHTAVARPLPVMELSGDPESEENRAFLTKKIREERENARAGIFVWILAAVLLLVALCGLYNSHGTSAVMCTIFLCCTVGIFLPTLSTAYTLAASERMLRGLKERPLRFERDEVLSKERRDYFNNPLVRTMSINSEQYRAEYGVVTLERAGTWAVGKGKCYTFAGNLHDYAVLPESGPVWLVYVPTLEQPYAIVITREDEA